MPTEEQLAQAEKIKSGVVHDPATYLKRISDDIAVLRRELAEVIAYMKRAESRIPEDFRRLSMVFHDVHDVKNAYTEMGLPTPPYIDRLIELLDDSMRHAVEDLEAPGGHFYKGRQEVVKRGDSRYDHNIPLLAAHARAEGTKEPQS